MCRKNGITSYSINSDKRDGFSPWMFWKTRRYVVAILVFFGFYNIYALRVNLSIGIVAMTEPTNFENGTGTYTKPPEFDWDSKLQGYVLSSFFYGYITTQLIGGYLASKFGGKRLLGYGLAVTAVLTVITPFVVKLNVYLFIAVRIIEGIFEGAAFPCVHAIWSRWAPPMERSRLATMSYSGSYVGTVISMPLCAYIAKAFGWESIFYFVGVVALIWFIIWMIVVAESPECDPYISSSELKYIQESLATVNQNSVEKVPWIEFFKSLPVWAIVASHFCENWGYYTLLTQLPKFMKDVLNFDLGKTGIMSALPYLAMTITMQVSGQLGDRLQVKGILNTTQVRKLFTCGAFLSQTAFMLAAMFWLTPVGCMICLTISLGLGAFSYAGFGVNHLDIAPQYAGILMGFTNTFGTIPGIVTPIVSGYIVTTGSNFEWQKVFYIASGIYLCGTVCYGLFGSGVVQPWALQKKETSDFQCTLEEGSNCVENKAFTPDM